jgi:GT2 family glycosyltransferase
VIPDVSVSVVVHGEDESCIDSLFVDLDAQKGVSWETLVFDNASSNGTVQRVRAHRDVQVFVSTQNDGFSKGHNHNIKASRGRYVLLLNPDVRFPPDLLLRLVNHLESHPSDGLVGPSVLEGDELRVFPPRRFYPGEGMIPLEPGLRRSSIAWLNGCCLMLRREVFDKTGGFDEDFFLYQSETDLCLRARRAGFTLGWVPEVSVHHLHRQSQLEQSDFEYACGLFEGSSVFWRKHYEPHHVAEMARFQIAISQMLLFLNRPFSPSGPLSSRLGRDRLRARRDVCMRLLSSMTVNGTSRSGALMQITSRQARIAFEWIRQGRFPLDDY